MRNETGQATQKRLFVGRLERERVHFNKLAERDSPESLVMPQMNVDRYDRPPAHTPFPLEYAFHLLGNLSGRTVVDIGCGEGLNTVILASLGARVLAVDISEKSLDLTASRARANGVEHNVTLIHSDAATIPVEAGSADRVLCAAILHHVDCEGTAHQIHRLLKRGGVAVFSEPLMGPGWFATLKSFVPKSADVSNDECPLTMEQIERVSRTIGQPGRRREFMLTTRLVMRAGVQSQDMLTISHRLDAWIFKHARCSRALASPLVWEARKL